MADRITLNKLAYDFIELYRANYKDTDSLSVRQVKNWIHSIRATLLKNRFDKNPFGIDESFIQSLGNVTVANATLGNKSGVKSSTTIPLTINRRGYGATFTRISDTEFSTKTYNVATKKGALESGNLKFNSTEPYFFIHGGYLYGINITESDLTGTTVYVEGVFQNPKEVAEYLSDTTFDSSTDYPIDLSMRDLMKEILIKSNFRAILEQAEDKIANSVDDKTV